MAKRFRNFATVIYLDSAPADWQERLFALHVPCFISPYHDQDVNPDGEIKKPHYHVMLMYDGVKSEDQVKMAFQSFGGVGFEVIQSIRGYARYLCHLDNPDKHQYPIEEVIECSGSDYLDVITLATDTYKAICEMMAWVRDTECYYFALLADYASQYREDWFRVLTHSCTIFMKEYIKTFTYLCRSVKMDILD